MDFDLEAHAESTEDLLAKAVEHSDTVRKAKEISPELAARVQAAIRDE